MTWWLFRFRALRWKLVCVFVCVWLCLCVSVYILECFAFMCVGISVFVFKCVCVYVLKSLLSFLIIIIFRTNLSCTHSAKIVVVHGRRLRWKPKAREKKAGMEKKVYFRRFWFLIFFFLYFLFSIFFLPRFWFSPLMSHDSHQQSVDHLHLFSTVKIY